MFCLIWGTLSDGGEPMETGFCVEKNKTAETPCFRLNPDRRLCPLFDSTGIALFRVADRGRMGFRVVSDFCQEHIQ